MECRKVVRWLKYLVCWEHCCQLGEDQEEVLGNLILLLIMTASFFVFHLPEMESIARGLPCCRAPNGTTFPSCEEAPGMVVVLRLSLVYVLFFLITFGIAITVRKNEKGLRFSKRGLWLFKAILIGAACFGATYIKPRKFDNVWTSALALGAAFFIVVQMYTFIRLSYLVVVVLRRMAENGSKTATRIQTCLFICGVILPLVGEGLIVLYYPLCGINAVLLITNAVIPFLACLWSISDCVRAINGYSSVFQGSILALFVVIYTWSAFTNNPSKDCNPYFGITDGSDSTSVPHILTILYAFSIYIINTSFTYRLYVEDLDEFTSRKGDDQGAASSRNDTDDEGPDGYKTRVYNRLFCEFLETPMICFIVMTIVNWCPPSARSDPSIMNKDAMWFKLLGCWLSVIFFIITLYIPSVYGVTKKKSLLDKS